MTNERSKKNCGPQVEIIKTENARVTQCPCGTVHVTLPHNGITLMLTPEQFTGVAKALTYALNLMGQPSVDRMTTGFSDGQLANLSRSGSKKVTN